MLVTRTRRRRLGSTADRRCWAIVALSASHRRAADSDQRIKNRLKIEGRTADDLQNVGCRGLLLERLPTALRVRACTSSNSRTFSIAITAWSAKVCDELDLLFGERFNDAAHHGDDADRHAVADERNA